MRLFATLLFTLLATATLQAQSGQPFRAAEANKKQYRVVYQLNSDDEHKIQETVKNIQNALTDPRLTGKLVVELVVHGNGVAFLRKDKTYEPLAKALHDQGVVLAQCENTMRMRKITPDELFPFVSYVPSGNGELIIRQQDGWAIIHP